MNHWYVLDVTPEEELSVSQALSDIQIDHYVPMESRAFRMGRKGGKCLAIEVPMLTGLLFLTAEITIALTVRERIADPKIKRHVEGLWCDGQSMPLMVNQRELARFRSEVDAYLELCRQNIAKGLRMPAKPKALKFNMADLQDEKVKAKAMQKLFGILENETP